MDKYFMSTAAPQLVSKKEGKRIVVMGVSGSGKSSIGMSLATRLGVAFADGDMFHAPESVAKMTAGIALADEDRWPWLDRIGNALIAPNGPGVIACSALRRVYRERLALSGAQILFVYLEGTPELIARRLASRSGHFMSSSLLESQFATLEPPAADENAICIDVTRSINEIIDATIDHLERFSA